MLFPHVLEWLWNTWLERLSQVVGGSQAVVDGLGHPDRYSASMRCTSDNKCSCNCSTFVWRLLRSVHCIQVTWSHCKLLWFDPLTMGYHRTYQGTYHRKLPIQPLQIQVRQILRSNASCPNCSPFCPGTVQVSSTQVSCISNCKDSGWSKPNMILSLLLMLRHERWQVKTALPSGNMTQQCRCPFPKKRFKGNSTVQLVKHRLVLKPLECSCPFL